MMFKRRAQAGVYAEDRYRRGLRRWRAKIRLVCLAISGPLIVVGIGLFFAEGHFLSWFAGGLTVLGVSAWVELRDTPPSYIENWRDGAEGERKTEKALRPLERAGWRIVHDVENGYGNYDHIAVARAGVFLLETKTSLVWSRCAMAFRTCSGDWIRKTTSRGSRSGLGRWGLLHH